MNALAKTIEWRSGWFAGLVAVVLSCFPAMGQGNFDSIKILRTMEGDPLITLSDPLLIPTGLAVPTVRFQFGFETDEVFAAGTVFDAVTVSFATPDGGTIVYVSTLDAGGAGFALVTPGAYQIDRSTISELAIAPPLIDQGLLTKQAFDVTVMLPGFYAGQQNQVRLDLFDNRNGTSSLGWISNVVIVPEPVTTVMLLAGGLLMVAYRRFRQ